MFMWLRPASVAVQFGICSEYDVKNHGLETVCGDKYLKHYCKAR